MTLYDKINNRQDFDLNKKNIGYIAIFAVILIGCLWAFISAGIITRDFKAKLSNKELERKEVNIDNLLVTETKDGAKLWELFAENGHYDDQYSVAYLNDVIGNFYNDGVVTASFKSSRATYNATNKQIVLYDNTLIVYKDGSNVRANKIVWSGQNEKIVAIGSIRLEKPGEAVIYGTKAVLSDKLTDFQIIGRTKTELYGRGKSLL